MKAIVTKYHSATTFLGARISAETMDNAREYFPYDYDVSADENHRLAARAYAKRLGWKGLHHGGALDTSSNVYVREGGNEGNFVAVLEDTPCK